MRLKKRAIKCTANVGELQISSKFTGFLPVKKLTAIKNPNVLTSADDSQFLIAEYRPFA